MFTGIVAGTFQVESLLKNPHFYALSLRTSAVFAQDIECGASVCVDGVCLTVTAIKDEPNLTVLLSFDIIEETLKKTTLSDLEQGSYVNLERSLKFGSEIGGHLLTGHVSVVAEVSDINLWESNRELYFSLDRFQNLQSPKRFGVLVVLLCCKINISSSHPRKVVWVLQVLHPCHNLSSDQLVFASFGRPAGLNNTVRSFLFAVRLPGCPVGRG